MIPGSTTKLTEGTVASAATISVKTDIVRVTGAVQINTILPNFGGGQFSGIIFLIPVEGTVVLGTSGNINFGASATINRAWMLIYSKASAKWMLNSA